MKAGNEKSNQHFDPEKYKMFYCPSCRALANHLMGRKESRFAANVEGSGGSRRKG